MDILGIDLAKRTFDATLQTQTGAQHYQSFPNTPQGFAKLQDWLVQHGVRSLHACMEATNVYWEALATFLAGQGYTVSVVNPRRIKGYAQATMQRNKTDKLDSAVIAAFCAAHQPEAWQPLTDAHRRLRALVRHREDLLQIRLQQLNRLRDATDALVRTSLEAVLETIGSQLSQVEQQINDHLAAHVQLRTNMNLLTTIVGISVVTAAKLLAEFAALDQYESAKAAAADTGVTPSQHDSGTSVHRRPRMSKIGNANLRAALYFPAMTAMTHCPAFAAIAADMAAKGKPKKVIIGAAMRKLVHVVYGVLKHQTPYDPAKVRGPAAATT